MIKISINIKNVIESLSDLLTIGQSPIIPHVPDLYLNQDIKFGFIVPNKKNHVLIKGLYFFDSKGLMYALEMNDEQLEKEFGEETNPSQLNVKLIPLRIKPANTPNLVHLHIIMLLEIIYRYNKDLLTDEQIKVLHNYFFEHNPEVIQLNEKDNYIQNAELEFNQQILQPQPVTKAVLLMDKLSQALTQNELETNGQTLVRVSPKKSNKQVLISIDIKQLQNENIKGINGFTRYDFSVYCAVCTQWFNGNKNFTINQLYSRVSGKKNARPTELAKKELLDSVEKMASTLIKINATSEVEQYNLEFEKEITRNALYIEIDKERQISNNVNTVCFSLLQIPILFKYALAKNHFTTVSTLLFDIPLHGSSLIYPIRDYLIIRLAQAKNKKNPIKNIIKYDTVYEWLGDTKNQSFTKQKKHNIRNYIEKILDEWKMLKYIKNYKIITKNIGNTKIPYSVEIELHKINRIQRHKKKTYKLNHKI